MRKLFYLLILTSTINCAVYKTINVTSEPSGVNVSRAGVVIGKTPLIIRARAGDGAFCTTGYWAFDLEAGSVTKRIDPCIISDKATVHFELPWLRNMPNTSTMRSGTGFLINQYGLILTSNHIVQGAKQIEVYFNNRILPGSLVAFSEGTDIAVLKIEGFYENFIPLDLGQITIGDEVYTVGHPYPDVLGKEPKYTNGTISSLSGIKGDSSFLQISIPIQPGNSGGPLCNKNGHAIGIIASTAAVEYFYNKTGSLPQNVSWAVKIDYTLPLLKNQIYSSDSSKVLTAEDVRKAVLIISAK